MATSKIPSPMILIKNYVFYNCGITSPSASGVYYFPGASLDIGVDGYAPIAVTTIDWEGWATAVVPYIKDSYHALGLLSDIPQTIARINVKVTYIKVTD